MTPFGRQGGGFSGGVDGLLLFADRGGGLEGHANHDRFAVADAALNATGVVGDSAKATVFTREEGIVVFASLEEGARKAGADLKPLGGCLLYTSPSPRDRQKSRMPSSA